MKEGNAHYMKREEFLGSLEHKILVLDGAMGTMLQRAGLRAGEAPEALNLRAPEKVREIHESYLKAGADILQTNTFGGNRLKLSAYNMADKVTEINAKAVGIAKSMAKDDALVSASIGPTGAFLEPLGTLSFDECYEIFKEQVEAVVNAGTDLISIETMSDIYEMKACLLAIRDTTDIPVLAHMTFGENLRTLNGTDPAAAVALLEAGGATVVGANCSLGPKELIKVVEKMAEVAQIPLVVQPNAGMPQMVGEKTIYPVIPKEMGQYTIALANAGANIIGGCCGTTPEHISAIAKAAANLRPSVKARQNISLLSSWRTVTVLSPSERSVLVAEPIDIVEAGDNLSSIALEHKDLGAQLLYLKIPSGLDLKSRLYELQMISNMPLLIANDDPQGLTEIFKSVMGKAWIRLSTTSEEVLDRVLPVAKRFGAGLVIPTQDNGYPAENLESALDIVRDIAGKALNYGIPKHQIFIDITLDSQGLYAIDDLERLEVLKGLWEEFGFRTLEFI
jgi:5-methyltetrahydrofolate--homocysteine methyltransferase